MIYSVLYGHFEVAKYLIDCGADLHRKDYFGQTCISDAYFFPNMMKYLIAHGSTIEEINLPSQFRGITVLMIAVAQSSIKKDVTFDRCYESVEILLKHGANVNAQDTKYGYTPLMIAYYLDLKPMIQLLENQKTIDTAMKNKVSKTITTLCTYLYNNALLLGQKNC